MSAPETPSPAPPPRPGNSGCGTVLLVLIGIVLLLPGLCSLAVLASLGGGTQNAADAPLWLLAFAITAGGIALIVLAIKKSRR